MKTKNPYLTVNLTTEGLDIDAVLPSGFTVKVTGSLEALMPLLSTIIEEVRKNVKGEDE